MVLSYYTPLLQVIVFRAGQEEEEGAKVSLPKAVSVPSEKEGKGGALSRRSGAINRLWLEKTFRRLKCVRAYACLRDREGESLHLKKLVKLAKRRRHGNKYQWRVGLRYAWHMKFI